jgi:tRNA threonylcarbamoyladenosine biosynthesis protein TsaB
VLVLALDTALAAATAVVAFDDQVLAVRSEPMSRGHQEAIAVLTQAAMAEAGVGFAALDRIGVVVGPGSFTGLRVGLAFAKGLALAWETPLVGIGSLEALIAGAAGGRVAAAIDAGRGQVYLQTGGAPGQHPIIDALREVARFGPDMIVGSGAALLAPAAPHALTDARAFADPAALARLTLQAPPPVGAPRPLYLRAPDARTLAERGVPDRSAAP